MANIDDIMKLAYEISLDDSRTICNLLKLNNLELNNFNSALKNSSSEKEFYFNGNKYKVYDRDRCVMILLYISQSKREENALLFKRLEENANPRNYVDTACTYYDEEDIVKIDKVKNKTSQKKS